MQRVTAVLSVVVIVLMTVGVAAQAKPNFAGEWKLMVARGQGEPGVDLLITQSATAMTLEGRDGVTLVYKLDGSASKNTMAGRGNGAPTEQSAKAIWTGNHLVVTTTTGAGEETRTFSIEDGYLVVDTATPRSGGAPTVAKAVYQRYERGFGG